MGKAARRKREREKERDPFRKFVASAQDIDPGEAEDNPFPPGTGPNNPVLTDETIDGREVRMLWQVPPEVRVPYENRKWKMPRHNIAAIALDSPAAVSALEHGKCRVKDMLGKIGMKILAISEVLDVESGRSQGQTMMLGMHCWNCDLHTWTSLVFVPTRQELA